MLFRRKDYFIKEFDERLIEEIEELRDSLMKQKHLIANSLEPSEEIVCHMKITEAKYYFLIKEARNRGVRMI